MVRDRSDEFRQKAGIDGRNSEEFALVDMKQSETNALTEKVESITELINQMESLVQAMKKAHVTMLSSPKIDDAIKESLDDINMKFKMLSKKSRENINSLHLELVQMEQRKENNSAIYRMKQVQHSALQNRLVDTVNDYNTAQVEYRMKSQELLKRQIAITNQNIDDKELERIMENPSEVFIQGHLTETREAREQLAEIQARHADILNIEKSIRELNEMFLDMANLVTAQGEMIDRIENHVTIAHEYAEKGKEQTKQAMEYQRKARKLKFIVAAILICILILIIYASFW